MNLLSSVKAAAASIVLIASPVMATAGGRDENSNFLIWAFLGICALIVFMQVVPVVSLALAIIKGLTGDETLEEELKVVTSKFK